jgi:hypothetical protein
MKPSELENNNVHQVQDPELIKRLQRIEVKWESCIECGDEPTKRIGGTTYCDACSSSSETPAL